VWRDDLPVSLERTNTPATVFLTGYFAEGFPAESQRIAQRYPVGKHTQTHPDLTTLSDQEVRAEIERAAVAIEAATGTSPHPLFRLPFGARDERSLAVVNEAGYGGFRCTVDTLGWQGTSGGRSVTRSSSVSSTPRRQGRSSSSCTSAHTPPKGRRWTPTLCIRQTATST